MPSFIDVWRDSKVRMISLVKNRRVADRFVDMVLVGMVLISVAGLAYMFIGH